MNNKKHRNIQRPANYKGEVYFETGNKLTKKLEEIAAELEKRMNTLDLRHRVSDILAIPRNAIKSLWRDEPPMNTTHKTQKNEYCGLYAFARIGKKGIDWQYIGISQTIKRRFRAHTKMKERNHASWAYLMDKSLTAIPKTQIKHIHPCYFTFYQITDNMLLHMAEAYCVNKFRSKWNSFETH